LPPMRPRDTPYPPWYPTHPGIYAFHPPFVGSPAPCMSGLVSVPVRYVHGRVCKCALLAGGL